MDAHILPQVVASMARDVMPEVRRPKQCERDEDAWYEYSACVLGSRVSQDIGTTFTEALREQGLYPGAGSRQLRTFAQETEQVLTTRRIVRGRPHGYPFPAARARVLGNAASVFYSAREGLLRTISSEPCRGLGHRRWLHQHAPGLGPKQASLFLRNALGAEELAVLDVHILRYGCIVGLWSSTEVRASSIRWYELAEERVRLHAAQLGLSVFEFDITAWVVMRAYSKFIRSRT